MRGRLLLAGSASLAAACATTPRNPVLDKYPAGVEGRTSVTYYDVQGRTYAELHADMRRLGPKIYGSSFVGETRSPMTWSWRTESTTGGSCTMRDVRVRVNAEILLPRWTPPADADSSLVAEWKRFIAALETHEAGHKDISARAGRDLKDQLRALTGLCSQVGMRANDIARRIIDDATRAQKRYDAETRHGLTQGTGFGPTPAVPSDAGSLRCPTMTMPGLLVEIRDARSGRWIADSATVLARAGTHVDTLRAGAVERDGSVRDRRGVWERPGVYAVQVQRPGYRAWSAAGVAVDQGPCHVNTAVLRADLERDR